MHSPGGHAVPACLLDIQQLCLVHCLVCRVHWNIIIKKKGWWTVNFTKQVFHYVLFVSPIKKVNRLSVSVFTQQYNSELCRVFEVRTHAASLNLFTYHHLSLSPRFTLHPSLSCPFPPFNHVAFSSHFCLLLKGERFLTFITHSS